MWWSVSGSHTRHKQPVKFTPTSVVNYPENSLGEGKNKIITFFSTYLPSQDKRPVPSCLNAS